jgi:membrane protein DedA with SNARE-associated domain
MAGVVNMSVLVFFVLDGVGGLLFAIAYVGLGVIFQDAIASVFATLMQLGSIGVLTIVAALCYTRFSNGGGERCLFASFAWTALPSPSFAN